ncbi:MAG: type II secretion system F family protein, partial [bacterium]|nr:type II secretion system F family protein [bacterium]
MKDFSYTAKDSETGKIIKGIIQADDQPSAAAVLTEKGLFPIDITSKEAGGLSFSSIPFLNRISTKDKILFTRQLATLVKAGLPITQALNTAVDQVSSKKFKEILLKIKASVEGGSSLSKAFGAYPQVFNNVYVSMVAAGETSGKLEEALLRLADQLEKEAEIRSKIRGAMVYPAIVLVVIIGVLAFMLGAVLPQITALYKDFNKALPVFTVVLQAVTTSLFKFWYIYLIILIAAVAGIRAYSKTPNGRKTIDNLKIKAPPFNKLMQKLYMARFCRTLSSLINSGIPILEALRLSGDAVNNLIIKESILAVAQEVKSGKALSAMLAKDTNFLPLVHQMIKVGEDSGELGDMLDKVATYYENEVDQIVKNLSTLIEPVLIIVLGVLVGFIILGVLFPVYNLVGTGV